MTPQEIVQSLQALAVQAKEDRLRAEQDRIKAQEDRIKLDAVIKQANKDREKLEQDLGMR